MKLETYISDLLYRHDCVVVPGLGGFITNYRSAKIHPVSHTLRPPSKSIGFNVQLKDNDGLLANYIASCESISFAQAVSKVEQFVKSILNNLEHKKQASLKKIGTLTMDAQGVIRFEPDLSTNYLLDSFGLETIQSPAILRKSKPLNIQKQLSRGAKQMKQQKPKVNWKIAAVILPLIGLSTYLSFQQGKVSEAYKNYAYLNPFKEKPAAVYVPRTSTETTKEMVVETPTNKFISEAIEPKTIESRKAVESKAIIEMNNFHLVAGCFSSTENANKLVNQLLNQGYKSSVIGKSAQGLHRVAFNSYSNRNEAVNAMNLLKTEGKATWLLVQ